MNNRINSELRTVTTLLDVYTHVFATERFTARKEDKAGAILDLIKCLGLNTTGVKCIGDGEEGAKFITKYAVSVSGYSEMVDLFKKEVRKIA